MAMFGLIRNLRQERVGFTLYGAVVEASRAPVFYTAIGVPDTLDGRFELVGIHAFLLIRRLRAAADRQAAGLGQAVFDAMFSDMDINLREIGVGDMVIGKRVRAMWEAFHGRAGAYEAAMDQGDDAALTDAVTRNVWRGEAGGDAARVARIMRAQAAFLGGQDLAALKAGQVAFLPAEGIGA